MRNALTWLCGEVPPGLAALLVLIVLTLTVSTSRTVRVWVSEVTVWERAAALAPHKPRPLNNLGVALAARGQWAEARVWFTRAHQAGHAATLPAWDRIEGEQTSRANLQALDDLLAQIQTP